MNAAKPARHSRTTFGTPRGVPRRPKARGPAQEIRATTIRNAILEAARSMYAEGGYSAVTMRSIGDQLGLAAPSLYQYFLSKEQIFVALQQKTLDMLLAMELSAPAPDPVEDLRLFYWRYYEFSKNHPDYFGLCFLDRSTPLFDVASWHSHTREVLDAHADARVQRCISAGAFPEDTDISRAKQALWAAAHGAAALRMIFQDHTRNDQIARDALDLAISGLRGGIVCGPMEQPDSTPADRPGPS